MSDDRTTRGIQDALGRIVSILLPEQPWEDEDAFAERQSRAFEAVKEEIFSSFGQSPETELGPHISDLIRGKLVHDNPTPDPALRYSTLFSRFTTLPVLDKKWEVLYLLYLLSDSPPTAAGPRDIYNGAMPPMETGEEPDEQETGSFMGLHRLPNRRVGDPSGNLGTAGQWTGAVEAQDDGRKPKAVLLQESGAILDPSEETLLSALPFTLLGHSSKYLEFQPTGLTAPPALAPPDIPPTPLDPPNTVGKNSDTTKVRFFPTTKLVLPTTLPLPIISLLHTLAEPSLLYRSLHEFVQTEDVDGGLVGQSLRAAIGHELKAYISLIGGLEGEIRRALSVVGQGVNKTIAAAGVTLKRCVVWTREATMGLRLMSMIVEQSKGKKGGQLISTIHGFATSHGDPFVHNFAERQLIHVTRPFYDMLRRWIYDGELSDPYREFFVSEQDPTLVENSEGRKGASSVWQDKYKLDEAMVPSIVTTSFANKVFLIGKSLNFIRYGCGDSDWVNEYSKNASKELRYGDTATLENSIDEAYKTTMARLIQLMGDKFRLFEHITALKRYLLLGQGDFVALLMEGLSPNLERPANSIYRHNLTAQLEHAIRGSNAQHESQDVLRRLDARMLDPTHGDIGWDVFTLEYRVDAPVDVVITPYATRQYLKVFNMLWRIKRVEFQLEQAWRRYMTGARGVLGAIDDKVGKDWKVARCVCAEMIHFVNQLQYYILYQVIEKAWSELQAARFKSSCTLDDLIDAHVAYLNQITSKGLLSPESANIKNKPSSTSKPAEEESMFLGMLHSILKIMLQYKDAVDGLYSYSVAEYSRRQELSAKIEARTKGGQWGVTDADYDMNTDGESRSGTPLPGLRRPGSSGTGITENIGVNEEMLLSTRQRLKAIEEQFKMHTQHLLDELAYQTDMEMRMLGLQLNFNKYYKVADFTTKGGGRKHASAAEARKEKEREERERKDREGRDREAEKERERRRERERERERRKELERRGKREGKKASSSNNATGVRDGEGDVVMK